MKEWDIPGDYSRPICRRIVEEAGVPREMYATRKRAAAHLLHTDVHFLSPDSNRDYFRWLRNQRDDFVSHGKEAPSAGLLSDRLHWRWMHFVARNARRLNRAAPRLAALLKATRSTRLKKYARVSDAWESGGPRSYLFPWAFERAKEVYSGAIGQVGSLGRVAGRTDRDEKPGAARSD
jgi:hypothetical protein